MNYQDILLVINFVILFYIIYKINSLENDKIETFDASTDAAITTAVKKIYLADVEAIRLLSNFAINLSQGGMTIPGNITFNGNQTVTGDQTITNSIKGNKIDFGYNDTSREGNAGKIEYGTFDTNALCIIGKGIPNISRKVKLWDDVIVSGSLNVGADQTVNGTIKGNFIYSLDDNGNGFGILGNTNKNKWLFNNYPSERKLRLRPANADGSGWNNEVFTIDNNGNSAFSGQVNTGGKTNYPTGWRGGVRTIDVYASGAYGLGDENGNLITKIDNSGIYTNKIIVGTSADGVSNTITDGQHDGTALCIVGKTSTDGRRVKLWDDVIISRNLVVGANTTTGSLNVGGLSTLSQIKCDWIGNNDSNANANLNLSSSNDIFLLPKANGVVNVNGKLNVTIIQPSGNVHLSSSNGDVYLLAKGNNIVSKAWGGSGKLYVDDTLFTNKLVVNGYQKYMKAGMFQIKADGRCVDLHYGWILLTNANQHNVASRLSLYEKLKGTNGFVHVSPHNLVLYNDQNWYPHRLVVFPGYRVRLYMWHYNCNLKYDAGYYDWVTEKFPDTREPIHLIHVSLDTESDDNFGNEFRGGILDNYSWNTLIFPITTDNKNGNINDSNFIK